MSSTPAVSLVDTHCHLNLDAFDHDRAQVFERARRIGINKILIPGIDIETSRSAIRYSHEYPGVFAAVGVHPNSGATWASDTLVELKRLVAEQKVVAIGEIGLDYYRDFTPREIQRRMFLQQLELAAELGLPVVIHNREATAELMEILQDWHLSLTRTGSKLSARPGVLHSYSADVETAQRMVKLNFKLGIPGTVTFRNAQSLQSVVTTVPLENMLTETDAPYLAPHPFRGKRNEPANVRIVAEKIAELRNYPVGMVAKITTQAADHLFNWSEIH